MSCTPACGVVVGGLDVARDVLAAVVHDELHAVAADGVEVGAARDEGDVFAGEREFDADIAADGAGADDGDFHGFEGESWNPVQASLEAIAELADADN